MIFLKNYFISTTKQADLIPILHDVRLAIREAQVLEGLVTISLPGDEASLLITKEISKGNAAEAKNLSGARSLSIPFTKGELVLEPKQMIYLLDKRSTQRRREFHVQVLGETEAKGEGRAPARRRR